MKATVYQAIETKYLPATNSRKSRIKATCQRGSITIDYRHDLSGSGCHIAAADALCAKFVKEDEKQCGSEPESNPWAGKRVCGATKSGYVHVFTA